MLRRDRRADGAQGLTTLAFKLVLTPLLVAIASLAGRRWGPSVSGWLVGLPFTSGPVVLFLALEQGNEFAGATASGSIAGALANVFFTLAYVRAARRGWPVALALGSGAFAVATLVLRALPLGGDLAPLLALYVAATLSLALGIRLLGVMPAAPPRIAPPRWDLPVRMAVGTLLVLALTAVATTLGPRLTGIVTTYPLYAGLLTVFAHLHDGPAAATLVQRGLLHGLFAFASFFLTIGVLIVPAGTAAAFVAAAAVALLVQSLSLRGLRREVTPL